MHNSTALKKGVVSGTYYPDKTLAPFRQSALEEAGGSFR